MEWQRLTDAGPEPTGRDDEKGRRRRSAVRVRASHRVRPQRRAGDAVVDHRSNRDCRSTQGTFTRTSYGGFANVSNGSERYPLLFGVGGLFTRDVDQNNVANPNVVDNYWLWQSFAAVQYVVFQQLYIKLVGSYSRGSLPVGQHESRGDLRRRDVQRPSSIRLLLLAATRRARKQMRKTSTLIGLTLVALGAGARAEDRAPVPPAPAAAVVDPIPATPPPPERPRLRIGLSFLPMGLGKFTTPNRRHETQGDALLRVWRRLGGGLPDHRRLQRGDSAADHLQRELQGESEPGCGPRPRSSRPT